MKKDRCEIKENSYFIRADRIAWLNQYIANRKGHFLKPVLKCSYKIHGNGKCQQAVLHLVFQFSGSLSVKLTLCNIGINNHCFCFPVQGFTPKANHSKWQWTEQIGFESLPFLVKMSTSQPFRMVGSRKLIFLQTFLLLLAQLYKIFWGDYY